MTDPETVLLIDCWEDQEALDMQHASPMMEKITEIREKYDLHMEVERYVSDGNGMPGELPLLRGRESPAFLCCENPE